MSPDAANSSPRVSSSKGSLANRFGEASPAAPSVRESPGQIAHPATGDFGRYLSFARNFDLQFQVAERSPGRDRLRHCLAQQTIRPLRVIEGFQLGTDHLVAQHAENFEVGLVGPDHFEAVVHDQERVRDGGKEIGDIVIDCALEAGPSAVPVLVRPLHFEFDCLDL